MKLVITKDGYIDLGTDNAGLLQEATLQSAVIISLLSDRRAQLDDRLPNDQKSDSPIAPDRRGWCGDALTRVQGDRIGSRLWLLSREKQTEETRRRAISYAKQSLQWLLDDGDVKTIDIDAAWTQAGRLEMTVAIALPNGSVFNMKVLTGVAYGI